MLAGLPQPTSIMMPNGRLDQNRPFKRSESHMDKEDYCLPVGETKWRMQMNRKCSHNLINALVLFHFKCQLWHIFPNYWPREGGIRGGEMRKEKPKTQGSNSWELKEIDTESTWRKTAGKLKRNCWNTCRKFKKLTPRADFKQFNNSHGSLGLYFFVNEICIRGPLLVNVRFN